VAQPSRHADVVKLQPRAVEQRSRVLAMTQCAKALGHERLILHGFVTAFSLGAACDAVGGSSALL
jgi:hypothetical protein